MTALHNLKAHSQRATIVLKSLANERRLMILAYLAEGEKSVTELEQLVDLSQSALSQHLARLRRDGIVATRRKAQMVFYSLNNDDAETIMGALDHAYQVRSTSEGANDDTQARAAAE